MFSGPLDSITTLSPLDHLSIGQAFTPRTCDNSGAFAEHLQPPPQPTAAVPVDDNSTKPAKDDRDTKSETSSNASPNEQPKVADKQSGDVEREAATASADNSADSELPGEEAVAVIEAAAVKGEHEESAEDDEEKSIVDELLLTAAVAPPAAPVVEVKPASAVVAKEKSADKNNVKSSAAAAADKTPDAAEPHEAEAIPIDGKAKADLEGKKNQESVVNPPSPGKPVDFKKVEAGTALPVASEPANAAVSTTEQPIDDVARGAQVAAPAQARAVAETQPKHLQPQLEEPGSVKVDAKPTVEVAEPAVNKGREAKRERVKGDAKSGSAKDKQADNLDPAPAVVANKPEIASPTASANAAIAVANLAIAVDGAATQTAAPPAPATPSAAPPESLAAASRLPEHFLARGAARGTAGTGGPPVTTAEQARLIQRVAKAFQAAQTRGGELRLRLSPPELGALKLEIKLQSGVMTARLETESSAAKEVLLDNLPALKERLAEQGIQVEKFDVDLMDHQQSGQHEMPQGQQQRSTQRIHSAAMTNGAPKSGDVAASEVVDRTPRNDGRLNVTV